MPKFKVHVTRDASVTFSADVEARDLDEVKAHLSKHGYRGPITTDWVQSDVNTYDNVEHYTIEDSSGQPVFDQTWN